MTPERARAEFWLCHRALEKTLNDPQHRDDPNRHKDAKPNFRPATRLFHWLAFLTLASPSKEARNAFTTLLILTDDFVGLWDRGGWLRDG